MSDALTAAIDRLEKTISDLKGTIAELVGDSQIMRMKQAMMADRIRKISIRVRDYDQPQDQHGPSIPAQTSAPGGAREVQQRLEGAFGPAKEHRADLSIPRCTNCVFSRRKPFGPWTCVHARTALVDPVTGEFKIQTCLSARKDAYCGTSGRFFVGKPNADD